MAPKAYLKGPKLFSLARKKALRMDIPQHKGIKLSELICRIQEKEGNIPCYQRQEMCDEAGCCWQASCNSRMIEKTKIGKA
ncbi:hypothetical protein [Desulfosediminicola flagellatus]|uniref:hypothetical protein n=1 Tax=Desulfosediminicola flagellatus TaxID=2569541 RepID=UPI0010ACCB63|nr:hypothetical protein [Desulfosediminicola flagellatus]